MTTANGSSEARGRLRVAVLTTSYPAAGAATAGVFVRDAVEALRAEGVDATVVSPASFRHFGIALGAGIVGNLRNDPWRALLLPLFLLSFVRAARRASRTADIVHAHWLVSGLVATACGRPFVLQPWGTDVVLARRARPLARWILRRAAAVVCASETLAADVAGLGARRVVVVPAGVRIPADVAPAAEPPHVLYAGRLSEEKGILEFLEATTALPRVIVGDGPLRHLVPEAVGFVEPSELGGFFDRAAVVCVPSRREGYGVVAREAMAHGRPVVATRAGGLPEAVLDGQSGFLVDPGDVSGLRDAVTRILDDAALRARLGACGRERALDRFSLDQAARRMIGVYAEARG